jgi:dTDP-glucose pyrophosphorylase/CBS domain-containing protein
VKREISVFCVRPESSLDETIRCIDRNTKGIALVVDADRRLIATITDGDVRRWILAGVGLQRVVHDLLDKKTPGHTRPITATIDTDPAILLQLMNDALIRQVPLLDEAGRVVDLVTLDDLVPSPNLPLQAVIMAGGFGTRLLPLTADVPKPMLPIGDRPLMELIIDQLRRAGISRINVTTHHQAQKIKSHFNDGADFGVDLHYVDEDQPLGTAGALGLMSKPSEPLLVINGDILTEVNFRDMLSFHREHHADMTVAVRKYDIAVPYGVIESDSVYVQRLTEKPNVSFFVSAGIYLLEPSVHSVIPNREHFNMTDVIQRLIDAGRPVVSFPVREYWLDIGRHADYVAAQDFIAKEHSS